MTDTFMTSRQLDREATVRRERIASTLDELGESLTPGRVLDEVLSYAKSGGGNFLMGLGKAAAANPMPTLLISTGCALFLSGRGKSLSLWASGEKLPKTEYSRSVERGGKQKVGAVSKAVGGLTDAAAAVAGSVSKGAEDVGAAASDAGNKIVETARDASDYVTGGVRDAGETIGKYAQSVKTSVGENASSMQRKTTLLGRELNGRAAALFEEQPLLVAAGGLLLGAALAACLPRTKTEDTYFGDTSEDVKRGLLDGAVDQIDRVGLGVERIVKKVKATAEEQDLVGTAAAGIKDLSDKLTNTLKAGKEVVAEEVEEAVKPLH